MSNEPAFETPSAVVSRALGAYDAARWEEFASLVHADALDEFRQRHMRMTDAWEQNPIVAAARDDADAGDLERAFNEQFSVAAFGNPVLRFFARVDSVEQLRALAPGELLARYLEAQAPRTRSDDPEYRPPVATRTVIGEVGERPDLVHVVYRVRTDVGRHGRTEEVSVVPVRRTEGGWRLMLNGELAFTGSMRSANADSVGG
jgi:hypothetical protein